MGRDERIGTWMGRTAYTASPVEARSAGAGTAASTGWGFCAGPARLEAFLRALRAMPGCPCFGTPNSVEGGHCCSEAVRNDCVQQLRRLGAEVLDYLGENFSRENTLMRQGGAACDLRERFDLHTEDHGSIMSSLVSVLEMPQPCAQKRALGELLDAQVRRHLMTHDSLLREQLPRLYG